MSTFHIDASQVWRVICKQCQAHQKFSDVEDAHNWMAGHERDCIGIR